VSNRQSFESVRKWITDVNRLANATAVRLLVGNKADLEGERTVSRSEGETLADALGVPFVETSAKTAANVQAMFTQMCRAIADRQEAVRGPSGAVPVGERGIGRPVPARRDGGCC